MRGLATQVPVFSCTAGHGEGLKKRVEERRDTRKGDWGSRVSRGFRASDPRNVEVEAAKVADSRPIGDVPPPCPTSTFPAFDRELIHIVSCFLIHLARGCEPSVENILVRRARRDSASSRQISQWASSLVLYGPIHLQVSRTRELIFPGA